MLLRPQPCVQVLGTVARRQGLDLPAQRPLTNPAIEPQVHWGDLHIRVIDRHTGELLRELTRDPTRDFQPRAVPPGPPRKNP